MLYPDPAMRLAISRAVLVESARGWRLDKLKQQHKIDVVVALSMACLAAVRGQGESSYPTDLSWVSDDTDDADAARAFRPAAVLEMKMRRRHDDDDDDDEVRDGETVRTRMVLTDTVPAAFAFDGDDLSLHRPGYRMMTSDAAVLDARAKARDAYDEYCRRISNAWRRPIRDFAEPDLGSRPEELRRHLRTEPDDDAQARRDRAWADYCGRISNAWRTNPRAATAIERQGERWRGGR